MQKYKLSKEGMDTLMNSLSVIAQEQFNTDDNEDVEGLLEAPITSTFVEYMTLVHGIDEVIEKNEKLSKHFQGFLNLYGFNTLYDMYIYAKSCDILQDELTKSGNLVPVKRKIVRNGKEIEVTIWENPNKATGSQPNKGNKGNAGNTKNTRGTKSTLPHARELSGKVVGDKDLANPANVAKIKVASQKLTQGSSEFLDTSQYYFTLSNGSTVVGVIGYSEQGEYLKMDFYRTNGQVHGVAARGFFELINLALEHKKGIMAKDDPQARPVFAKVGLQQNKGYWSITYDELKINFGERDSNHD